MKKFLLAPLLLLLFLLGCGSEPKADESKTLANFYSALQPWLAGDRAAGEAACQFLSESQLQDAASYARSATEGDLCQGALEENFTFLAGNGDKLSSIETVGPPERVERREEIVWVQPVSLKMTLGGKKQETLARSAAVISDGKIQSLDGMRISTVAPEQFAENLGTPTVIRVDPVLAAYFSAEKQSK